MCSLIFFDVVLKYRVHTNQKNIQIFSKMAFDHISYLKMAILIKKPGYGQ